ncbi:MAG: acyl-CoA dehydrogenase family protein [Pseudomonadota bacterium]
MKFDFSEDQYFVKNDARRFLNDRCSMEAVRQYLDSDPYLLHPLWQELSELGWPGVAIPEAYGGWGMGYLELCVLAEELGRVAAPVPFSSSIYLAAEALLHCGSEEQKQRFLPAIASGQSIGTVAWSEAGGAPVIFEDGHISGNKRPVVSGTLADVAVVSAATSEGGEVLVIAELGARAPDGNKCVSRQALPSVDPSLRVAQLSFNRCPAEVLSGCENSGEAKSHLLDRAAVMLAFEQVGGSHRCQEMTVDYVKERKTFGRSVGSYQAVKHKLAKMYTHTELARSNAFYGAWALAAGSRELPLAAGAARITASESFEFAAREGLHLHGGMGYTWEVNCHLFLKRSRALALRLGSVRHWKERLITQTLATMRSPETMPAWLTNS